MFHVKHLHPRFAIICARKKGAPYGTPFTLAAVHLLLWRDDNQPIRLLAFAAGHNSLVAAERYVDDAPLISGHRT